MIIRGYLIDYRFIWNRWRGALNFHLVDQYYLLAYIVPILATVKGDRHAIKYAKNINWFLNLLFITSVIFFFNKILNEIARLYIGNADISFINNALFPLYSSISLFPLLRGYIPKRLWLLNFISLLIFLLLAIATGRRGTAITAVGLLLGTWMFGNNQSQAKKLFIFSVFACTLFSIYSGMWNNIGLFDFILNERGFADNRSHVDVAMLNQMSMAEMIFGKGLNGRYYYPLLEDDYLKGWRYVCETGFFNLVLKGGFY